MADIPKAETSDMSIDELSAAIDEHMMSVSSGPKKAKKTPAPPKKPEPKIKVETKPEPKVAKVKPTEKPEAKPEPKEENKPKPSTTKSSKIKVRKSGYISKSEDEPQKNAADAKEPDGRIATSKRTIEPVESKTEETKKPAKTSMVDVVVKQSSSEKPPEVKPDAAEEVKEETTPEEIETEKNEEKVQPDKSDTTKESEPAPEKPDKKEEEKPKPIPQRSNEIEELSAQIGDTKKDEEEPKKSDTLKTYDTKQYHIPIKPSHHHRVGSSFMVFAAVLAGILAVVFVLNELEIIDLAALVYTD